MRAIATLSGDRVRLRPWRDDDRETFAAMNADPRVMEFFFRRLSRSESDAMVDYLEKHFDKHGFGLWAVEVPGVAPFIGFTGLLVPRFSAHFTPCVEVGWRLALSANTFTIFAPTCSAATTCRIYSLARRARKAKAP